MMCSVRVATSSSWAALSVRGAHAGDAAHARRVAVLQTPATVGAESAPPKSSAACCRARRRLIVSRFTGRSEERRVGKEGRAGCVPDQCKEEQTVAQVGCGVRSIDL